MKKYDTPEYEVIVLENADLLNGTGSCQHSQEGFDVPTCPSGFDTCTGW